jgi:hypothetical protein
MNLYHDELESNLYAAPYNEHYPSRKTCIEIAGKVLTVLEEMINLAK